MVSRNAQLFLLGGFFLGIGQASFNSMANLYFEELGFSRSQIGGFRSVQTLGIVLMAIPTALLITRFRAKTILTLSTVLAAAGYLGQAFGQNFGIILAFCGLVGASTGVVRLAMAPLFMRSSSTKERVYLFGMHRVVRMIIAVGATLLAGKLIVNFGIYYGSQVMGYRYVLAGAGLLSLLGAIPFLLVRTEELTGAEEQKKFNLFKIRKKNNFQSLRSALLYRCGCRAFCAFCKSLL
jgi:MFS family permease